MWVPVPACERPFLSCAWRRPARPTGRCPHSHRTRVGGLPCRVPFGLYLDGPSRASGRLGPASRGAAQGRPTGRGPTTRPMATCDRAGGSMSAARTTAAGRGRGLGRGSHGRGSNCKGPRPTGAAPGCAEHRRRPGIASHFARPAAQGCPGHARIRARLARPQGNLVTVAV